MYLCEKRRGEWVGNIGSSKKQRYRIVVRYLILCIVTLFWPKSTHIFIVHEIFLEYLIFNLEKNISLKWNSSQKLVTLRINIWHLFFGYPLKGIQIVGEKKKGNKKILFTAILGTKGFCDFWLLFSSLLFSSLLPHALWSETALNLRRGWKTNSFA